MNTDPQTRYSPTHEWARKEGQTFVVGISDHAQESLGDVVYVDLPDVGTHFKKGEVFGVVESVKAANELYCPLDGEVVETHQDINKNPQWVNEDPYAQGWMIKLRPTDAAQWDALLSADDYQRTAK